MPVLVKVSQNKNEKTAAFGKWYGRVVSTKTMSYQELCRHMSEHNSIYGEDVCLGVANKIQSCILEQLLEGKKVQFGELGTFYLSVKSNGAEREFCGTRRRSYRDNARAFFRILPFRRSRCSRSEATSRGEIPLRLLRGRQGHGKAVTLLHQKHPFRRAFR